jgi:putative methyltransferase (TIGR04325 family)
MFFHRLFNKLFANPVPIVSYQGDFKTWQEADSQCDGYNSEAIFEKVKYAAMEVHNGNAVYERDSYLFYDPQYNYPLLYHLSVATIENNGILNVIDWGGALGSTYFQNKPMLVGRFPQIKWCVIEQKHFVEFGKSNLEDEVLKFEYSLKAISNVEGYNVVLLSSVLQYLDFSNDLINEIAEFSPQYIIVERTPVSDRYRIWIETVHEPIYEATYPCCVFEEKELINIFERKNYKLIDSWKSLVDGDEKVENFEVFFKSFVFKKNEEQN